MTKEKGFLFLSVILGLALVGYFVYAWSEPGSSPPGGNIPTPLNVGPAVQTKTGGLNLGGNLNLQDNKLIISSGDGEIYRSGGQITYQADDNWYWYSSWDGHNEMTLHYQNGLWVRSDIDADDLKARNQVCIGSDCRSSWPSETNLNGWSFANDYLYDDGEEVIRASDEWLRLNQAGHFTSGVYSPGKIRADGGLYVSDDERIYRCGEDYVCTDDNFMVTGNGWLRVDGSEGLYFQSYGGGWRMTDSTWIRSYGGKGVYVDSIVRADGGFQVDGHEMVGSNADKLYANRKNTTGGGIWISDDGGFYDYNNAYIDFRGSTGIRILESDGSWGNNSIRAANLCIQNDCRSSWPSLSESDTLQTVTNRGRVTSQTIRSPRFEDYNNTGFYLDPASTSYLNDVRASILYDRDNTAYYVNPASNSWLYRIYSYDIRVDIMYDRNNTSYYVNPAGTSKFGTINLGGVSRSSWPAGGDITAVYAGPGLTGGGTSGSVTLSLLQSGTCYWTGYVETGCSNSTVYCNTGYYVKSVQNKSVHNCNCMGASYECDWLRIRCCKLW